MRVVWDSEPCSVEAVYEVVSRDRDLKETTVRTLLRRLEQKGISDTKAKAALICIDRPSGREAWRLVQFARSSTDFAGVPSRNL